MTDLPAPFPAAPAPGPAPADAGPRVPKRAGLFLFLAALLPRLWSLDWAFPLKRGHIDEAVVVFYALRAAAGDANPRVFFDYPGFFLYALAALFKAVLFAARLLGQAVPSSSELLEAYTRGDGLMFLLASARALSAFLGALTAVVVLRFGARRWGIFAGFSAALLYAASPLAVLHAHYATVDTATAFLVLLAVERLASYWEEGARRDGFWSAFLIGLAAATKYFPGALVLFLLPAPFVVKDRSPFRTAVALGGASALSFLAASPYALLAAPSFARRFALLFPKIVGFGGTGDAFLLPTLKGIFVNVGFFNCAAGAAGMVLLLGSPRRGDKLPAAVFLFLLVFFGTWNAQSPHYALPLYPLLFLAAGRALSESGRFQRALPAGGLALLLAMTLPGTVRCLKRLSTPDTRLNALAWAREAFPSGSRILRFAHTPEFSPRDPFQVTVDWENRRLLPGAGELSVEGVDYLLYATYTPADDSAGAALSSRFRLLKKFNDPQPAFPHDPVVFIYDAKGKK